MRWSWVDERVWARVTGAVVPTPPVLQRTRRSRQRRWSWSEEVLLFRCGLQRRWVDDRVSTGHWGVRSPPCRLLAAARTNSQQRQRKRLKATQQTLEGPLLPIAWFVVVLRYCRVGTICPSDLAHTITNPTNSNTSTSLLSHSPSPTFAHLFSPQASTLLLRVWTD